MAFDNGKLSIASEMLALDNKDREFYDSLSDDEKKKFSTFLMIRYGATVTGDAMLQAYYLQATNQRLNKHYFDIKKQHDKLNWLAVTTISPGMGKMNHTWLAAPKKKSANNKITKFLSSLYPSMKTEDIELLAELNSTADIKALAKDMGMTPEQIKKDIA
jgi:hypothetical protein